MDYVLPGPPAVWLALACLAGVLLAFAVVWTVDRFTGWLAERGKW